MKIVSGGKWTLDSRWVVVGDEDGQEVILYDPGNVIPNMYSRTWMPDPVSDLMDCILYVKDTRDDPH